LLSPLFGRSSNVVVVVVVVVDGDDVSELRPPTGLLLIPNAI